MSYAKVIRWGTEAYDNYQSYIAEDFQKNPKFEVIYKKAFEIEASDPEKTFLFSAQHKSCIILAIILTEMYNSDTIIWRPDDVGHDKINIKKNNDNSNINISASFSLYDWNINESTNSFMGKGISRSFFNNYVCQSKLKELPLINIIKKWDEKLEDRHLCVFEFTDDQLIRYVDVCKGGGHIIQNLGKTPLKEIIKEIQEKYNNSITPYYQSIQARILTTGPNSLDPYITYILDSDDSINKMREEIKQYFNNEREHENTIRENSIMEQEKSEKKKSEELIKTVRELFNAIDVK